MSDVTGVDWVSFDDAKKRVRNVFALSDWARTGALQTRARSMTLGSEHHSNYDLSTEIWRIASERRQGFISWGDDELHCTTSSYLKPDLKIIARGIEFRADQLDALAPANSVALLPSTEAEHSIATKSGGRKMHSGWPEFVAELCRYIYDNGYPEGHGSEGTEQLIDAVLCALSERGLEDIPVRSTVQNAVNATLRLRPAKN